MVKDSGGLGKIGSFGFINNKCLFFDKAGFVILAIRSHNEADKTRVVKHTVPAESFFHLFSPPVLPEDDEELGEEEAEGLDAKLKADYEMGEEFKEKIIPHAVDFFTGKALEYEDYDKDSEFDEDEFDSDGLDEDDDDSNDDEDDDDDDHDVKSSKGENAPECKQS